MKKILTAIIFLLSIIAMISIPNTTVLAYDNQQYKIVKNQPFYCLEFQKFYNEISNTETQLVIDGTYNSKTEEAFNLIKNLIVSNYECCRNFQRFFNSTIDFAEPLEVDGIFGPATKDAIALYESLLKGTITPGNSFDNPYLTSKEYYCAEFQGFYNDNYKYGTRLVVDGIYGPATANAYSKMRNLISSNSSYCRKFQKFYNITANPSIPLVVDGKIGPMTINAYNHYDSLMH